MASTHLSRTQGTGNRQIFTYSSWIKRGALAEGFLFQGYTSTSSFVHIKFDGNNKLQVFGKTGGSDQMDLVTSRVFRDFGSFYNVVVAIDTTQATDTNRVKVYINGVQETSFSTTSYPSVNANLEINVSGYTNYIGTQYGSQAFFGGLMTHIHFVDGTAYPASTFGETDSTSGIWKPKTAPSVTHGTNGFFLKMENSGAMGTDSSGNSNTFTVSGTLTQNVDTPDNNFATFNPLDNYFPNYTFANGNTTCTTGGNYSFPQSSFYLESGKWYWEVKAISKAGGGDEYMIGVAGRSASATNQPPHNAANGGIVILATTGETYATGATGVSYGVAYAAGDIIGVALDLTNSKIYWSKNGTWMNSANPAGNTGGASLPTTAALTPQGAYSPVVGFYDTPAAVFSANFGNGYFGTTAVASANADGNGVGKMEYAVPSGYYTLNTKNLKEFG